MNERFLIPTAVAVALHALLFFGFPTEPPPIPDGSVSPSKPAIPPNVIEVEWPLATEDLENPPVAKGNPEEARPELPEPPVRDVFTAITIPREPPSIGPILPTTTIPVGPPGDPNAKLGPGSSGPLTPGHLDNVPRTRSQLAPVYPYEARKSGRPGEVVVEFIVDESGRVLDPHVIRSNDPIFEAPTLRAVSKWRFEPGRKNGRIVRFRMAVPVAFAVNP